MLQTPAGSLLNNPVSGVGANVFSKQWKKTAPQWLQKFLWQGECSRYFGGLYFVLAWRSIIYNSIDLLIYIYTHIKDLGTRWRFVVVIVIINNNNNNKNNNNKKKKKNNNKKKNKNKNNNITIVIIMCCFDIAFFCVILITSVGDSMDLHFWSPFQATQATYSTSGHGGNTGPPAFSATNEAPHPLLPFAPCRLEKNLWQIRVWVVQVGPGESMNYM